MKSPYSLQARREATNSVLVYRNIDDTHRELEWVVELERDDEPIVFCRFYEARENRRTETRSQRWKHGFQAVDPETGKSQFHELPFPPADDVEAPDFTGYVRVPEVAL